MYVLEEQNLGYIAHPKTASSAMKQVLSALGATLLGSHHDFEDEWCQPILDSGGLIMTTIRNPFDLMVSWYFHYAKRRPGTPMESFKEWLPAQLEHPNDYIKRGIFCGLRWANRPLRFENLQEDFDKVMVEVGLKYAHIEPFNVSLNREGCPYQEMYDDHLRQLIVYHFGDLLERHQYFFEE